MTELIELQREHTTEALRGYSQADYRKRLKRAEGRSARVKRRLGLLEIHAILDRFGHNNERKPYYVRLTQEA